MRIGLLTPVLFLLSMACTGAAKPVDSPAAEPASAEATADAAPAATDTFERRAFAPMHDGKPVTAGISYGAFREGQAPGKDVPSAEQILEDLKILSPDWHMVRVYSSQAPTETILSVIKDNDLPVQVVVGAWISPDEPEKNAKEVKDLIRLANAYPDQVLAVSVGNESQVDWSAHRSPRDKLITHIKTVRDGVKQPVTTADDYNFWNKPESKEVAAEVDFILLHAYAMWNGKSLDEAVPWTAETIKSIQEFHPGMPLVVGETGWATALNEEGSEREHIKAPAGEAEQARFYKEFRAWADSTGQPYFYFEAFDEPWKGSDDPREVEKHWGIYNVDRTPKAAAAAQPGTTP